ncbi:MAG: pirin family protein [Candidatus Hydrogenedentales bacterium]
MIKVRRSQDRGHADHGWLDTYHTFSFSDYRDPAFDHFSVLRVLNQDRVKGGMGFGRHAHNNMEIVSYVLEGVLEHQDSMGNGSQMRPGEVQLMSAGTGVTHSEFNGSQNEELHFLQMWIIPAQRGAKPRYEQRMFPESERRGQLRLVVSPDGRDGSLTIGQDASLYAGLLEGPERIRHEFGGGRAGWLHVARGSVTLNGQRLEPGDGAVIEGEGAITIEGATPRNSCFGTCHTESEPRRRN